MQIKLLEQVLGGSEFLYLQKSDKGVKLAVESPTGVAICPNVPMEIEGLGKEKVNIDLKAFTTALKGRENVKLSFTGNDMVVKSGKFVAKVTAQAEDKFPEIAPTEETVVADITIEGDAKLLLMRALQATKIEKTFAGLQDTLVYVKASSSKVLIATFEGFQVSYITCKNKVNFPECDFVLPSAVLAKVEQVQDAKISIKATESFALIKSRSIVCQLPLSIETVNAIPKDSVLGIIKDSEKTSSSSFQLDKAKLLAFLESAKGVAILGSEVTISGVKGGINLELTSAKGSVKEKMQADKVPKTPIRIDARFLQAMANKCAETIEVLVVKTFAVARSEGVCYISAISTGDNDGAGQGDAEE